MLGRGVIAFFLLISLETFGRTGPLKMDLLTSSPGLNLFSAFGHSAIRIYQEGGQDKVYSFGYIAFNLDSYKSLVLEGEVYSKLKVYPYQNYIYPLKRKGQSLDQLTLNLSQPQILAIKDTLDAIVAKNEGKIKHDFLKHNCVLVIHEILKEDLQLSEKDLKTLTNKTYRDIVGDYTGVNDWMLFYTDLIGGTNTDQFVTTEESFFIPYNYASYLSGLPNIVLASSAVENAKTESNKPFVSPSMLFLGLLILFVCIKVVEVWQKKQFKSVDNIVFLAVTSIGFYLLCLMAVNQYALKWNLDILWANPILVLPLLSRKYFNTARWLYVASLVVWLISWYSGFQNYIGVQWPLIVIVLSRLFYRKVDLPTNGSKKGLSKEFMTE